MGERSARLGDRAFHAERWVWTWGRGISLDPACRRVGSIHAVPNAGERARDLGIGCLDSDGQGGGVWVLPFDLKMASARGRWARSDQVEELRQDEPCHRVGAAGFQARRPVPTSWRSTAEGLMVGALAVGVLPLLAHLVPGRALERYWRRSGLAPKQHASWSYCAGILCAGLLGVACAGRLCQSPSPVMVSHRDTGFVECEGGWFHRTRRVEFLPSVPRHDRRCCSIRESYCGEQGGRLDAECADGQYGRGVPCVPLNDRTCCSFRDVYSSEKECSLDAECADGQYGRCVLIIRPQPAYGEMGCRCLYGGCLSDAECGPDQLCAPPGVTEGPVGTCVPATCRDDSDCGDALCSSQGEGGGFACQHPDDECDSDRDCLPLVWGKDPDDRGYRCYLSQSDGRRRCTESSAGQLVQNGSSAATPVLAREGMMEQRWPVWR